MNINIGDTTPPVKSTPKKLPLPKNSLISPRSVNAKCKS